MCFLRQVESPAPGQRAAARFLLSGFLLLSVAGCGISDYSTEPRGTPSERNLTFRAYSQVGRERKSIGLIEVSLPVLGEGTASTRPRVTIDSQTPAAVRSDLPRTPSFGLQPRWDSLSATQGPEVRLQPRLQGRRFETRMRDGRPAHAIVSGYRVPGSRDAGTVVSLYAEDRLIAIQELVTRGAGRQRLIRASRLTLFDSTGAALISIESGPETGAQTTSLDSAPRDALATVAAFLSPTSAYADMTDNGDGVPCLSLWLGFIAATAAEGIALGATAAVALSCFYLGGLTCPGLASALAGVGIVSLEFIQAVLDLEDCLQEQGHSLFGNGGSTGIPGSGNEECYWVWWWISYDGGQTWELYEVDRTCSPVNAT